MNFDKFFQEVPDFRINRRKRHKLVDILSILVCAVVCGANGFEKIAMYGQQKVDFLPTFLELPNGIPWHDTFNRVFELLDKDKFSESLYRWSKQILSSIQEQFTHISIDGKVLCGTAESGKKSLVFVSLVLGCLNIVWF